MARVYEIQKYVPKQGAVGSLQMAKVALVRQVMLFHIIRNHHELGGGSWA